MTKTERAKIKAIKRILYEPGTWKKRFVKSLAWIERNEPSMVLSTHQKWALDRLVWRFRRRLAGEDGFEIPEREPQRADYIQAHEERCERRRAAQEKRYGPKPVQGDLF